MKKRLALLSLLLFTSCAGLRSTVRDMANRDMVGETAPGLVDGEWLGEEARIAAEWTLVAFLLPW